MRTDFVLFGFCMIKLGKLTDYAVVVLAEMARGPGLLSAAVLAERTGLSEATVAKILKILAGRGLLVSARGAQGGYRLERAAASLPVTEIIAAMEGPISLTACADGEHDGCLLQSKCAIEGRWGVVNKALVSALSQVTLADMARAPVEA